MVTLFAIHDEKMEAGRKWYKVQYVGFGSSEQDLAWWIAQDAHDVCPKLVRAWSNT
jgi:hypothetical protein